MKKIFLCLALAIVIFTVGCKQPQPIVVKAPQVDGTITLDGQPVSKAKVVFLPRKLMSDAREIIPLAYAITDNDGRFELKLSDGSTNVLAGDYRVIISKRDEHSKPEFRLTDLADGFSALLPDDFEMFREKTVRKEIFPARFNTDTILTFTVESGSEHVEANFALAH